MHNNKKTELISSVFLFYSTFWRVTFVYPASFIWLLISFISAFSLVLGEKLTPLVRPVNVFIFPFLSLNVATGYLPGLITKY